MHQAAREARDAAIETPRSAGVSPPRNGVWTEATRIELSGGMRQRAAIAIALACHLRKLSELRIGAHSRRWT